MLHAPRTTPQDYGMGSTDYHLKANAKTQTLKAWRGDGTFLWEIPCLATGQRAEWWLNGGDTPPSVYKLGKLYNDRKDNCMTAPYGWLFFDMVDCDTTGQEDGENTNQRSEIGMHGGGSGLSDPYAPLQPLRPTRGCLRLHNQHLETHILPLYEKGAVYVSVLQDDA